MEYETSAQNPPGEISIFCPVRLYVANRRFDGLLDTVDAKGGGLYILTDDDPAAAGLLGGLGSGAESRGELALGTAKNEFRIPFRLRGMRIDDDGLYAYARLAFDIEEEADRRRLEEFIASLW
jgi:hypothetical protein